MPQVVMSVFFYCVPLTCCIWENVHTVNVSLKAILLHAKQAQRGGRGIALPILNLGARRERVVSIMPWLLHSWERDPVPVVQEAEWTSGPVWMSLENLVLTRVRTLDCPAPNKSLYQVHYLSCHTSAGSDVYFGYGVAS
jgi:hypothetical protein